LDKKSLQISLVALHGRYGARLTVSLNESMRIRSSRVTIDILDSVEDII
jgi:hypothetical protein